jgi:Flp pilus assembly protein TadG
MCHASKFRNRINGLIRLVRGKSRAQAMVELAIIAPVALILLLIGVQLALIGDAALALGQVAYQGARYEAVNTNTTSSSLKGYMVSVGSPLIAANSGSYLTINSLSPDPGTGASCAYGSTLTLSVSFDIAHLIMVPNPFLGIQFPSTLKNSQSAFCEG